MACFITPATLAVATTLSRKKISSKLHINWLNNMLWGGVLMLTVEHIASGEIIFSPPFLSAMKNAEEIPVMLTEMATVGGTMTLSIVVFWIALVFLVNKLPKLVKKYKLNLSKGKIQF